jgi:threonine synthase
MWRYAELLPTDAKHAVTLGEGFTPLVEARRGGFFFKLEFSSPTGSFKDRGSSVLISKAVELKARATAIDSSGNAAASLSAYSAKAGLPCYVFAPAYASPSKLLQSQSYGSRVFKVEGTRRDT